MDASTNSSFRTYLALVSTFTSFFTVALHTILYERAIYPAASFLLARKYNCPVRQNRHPQVCKWVEDAVEAVRKQILKGTVSRVAVVIYTSSSKPLERFVFDLSRFPFVPPSEALAEFEAATDDEESSSGDATSLSTPLVNVVDLEEQFRAVMRKLAFCSSALGPTPEGCSFTICIDLKDQVDPPIGHPQPWIPSLPPDQRRAEAQAKASLAETANIKTTPVRAVEAGEFLLEMWVEQVDENQSEDVQRQASQSES